MKIQMTFNIKPSIGKIKEPYSVIRDAVPKVLHPLPCPSSFGTNRYYNLIKYYGGKFGKLEKILPYIKMVAQAKQATTYIECFGGGGKCLLNLDTINHHFNSIIYNEWDAGLCSLFRMASNENTATELIKELNQFEYTKGTFIYCRTHRKDKEISDLYRACMTFILCQMSYNGGMHDYSKQHEADMAFYNAVERIALAPSHLKDVQVINGDYIDMMNTYGSDSLAVKYLDPPYHPICRNQDALKEYSNELSITQHKEMVELLCQSSAWILSGYDPAQYGCNDYESLIKAGATKVCIGSYMVSSQNGGTNHKEEFIWYKE